ncbi:SPOR domain-containing protein [Thauera sp.]|uniref:SPOR domain-containing protein n=1 Tax=Thauera sp. TaxID=1905334 RepID=UPI00260915C0|nr:SPOR domain-containing protein [Thauera sp.]
MTEADSLEIKKRARRRLVGAVALALLAAVVLPMMMDEEPHPSIQDIQISIPDRDAAGSPRRAAPASESASAPVAVAVPEDDEAVTAEKPAAEAPAAAAQPSRPAVSPAPSVSAAPRPAEPRAAAPAAETRTARTAADEEARVRALIEGKGQPVLGDSYVLQIGAFSDAAKAGRLVDDLRARGFQAYTERAGSVTRVRVGPVAGRVAADTVAARLKAAGHPAVLQPR